MSTLDPTVEKNTFFMEKSHWLHLSRVHVCPFGLHGGDATQAAVDARQIQRGLLFLSCLSFFAN